jgi:ribosomal protein S18 acetylase RimI-like enzyme
MWVGTGSVHPIGFRRAVKNDLDFLYALHAATMREYVDRTWGWDDVSQEAAFRRDHTAAEIQIVTYGGQDVGMLSVEDRDADIFVRAIEIAPEYQGKGIGTAILRKKITDASKRKKPVSLHVLKVNPARRLYDRLGFLVVEETPTHFYMSTNPAMSAHATH